MLAARASLLRSVFSSPLVAVLSLSLTACGGSAIDDTSTDDGGGARGGGPGTGAVGSGAESSGGAASGGSASGGSASGGTGGNGESCSSFDDHDERPVEIVVTNEFSVPIYIGPTEQTCGDTPKYAIYQDGKSLPYFDDFCSPSCEQLRLDGYLGCPAACFFPETLMLAPGESHVFDWNGRIHTERTLPVECVVAEYGPEADEACYQRTAIEAGTYTFEVSASTELDCSDSYLPDNGCGTCVPDASGGCRYTGGLMTGTIAKARTTADLDPQDGIGSGDPIFVTFTE